MRAGFDSIICSAALIVFSSSFSVGAPRGNEQGTAKARKWLLDVEPALSQQCGKAGEAGWKFSINITAENSKTSNVADSEFSLYMQGIQQKILKDFPDWPTFTDPLVKRQLKFLAISGPGNMTSAEVDKLNQLNTELTGLYSKATVCSYKDPKKCNMYLDPDIEKILTDSTDFDELAYYFNAWHDSASKAIPAAKYKQYVDMSNREAQANGMKSTTDFWLSRYDDGTADWKPQKFIRDMVAIQQKIKPYYDKLYAYVRMKLRANSPFKDRIQKCGKIPIHITGNMWGQNWVKLERWSKPFPRAPSLDITPLMKKMNFTIEKIYRVADDFIQGVGLKKLTNDFWKKSVFSKPAGAEADCHPSASDMCYGKGSQDFRIKMCTEVNMDNLVTVHHEIGHIQYFHYYTDLPFAFRDGANPGFHEAIGDSLALAVTTPKHLQCSLGFQLGLSIDCSGKVQESGKVTETDINHLFHNALEMIPVPGFAMALDEWRFQVFDGVFEVADYNKKWWEIREKYTGMSLPNARDDSKFDPAAKYHIPAHVEYIRYFFSNMLEFSLYEAMCKKAGEYNPRNPKSKPLYQCDFSGNKAAGKLLGSMLAMGFQQPWPTALEAVTGQQTLQADSFLKYFQPLFTKIDEDLKAGGELECLQQQKQ